MGENELGIILGLALGGFAVLAVAIAVAVACYLKDRRKNRVSTGNMETHGNNNNKSNGFPFFSGKYPIFPLHKPSSRGNEGKNGGTPPLGLWNGSNHGGIFTIQSMAPSQYSSGSSNDSSDIPPKSNPAHLNVIGPLIHTTSVITSSKNYEKVNNNNYERINNNNYERINNTDNSLNITNDLKDNNSTNTNMVSKNIYDLNNNANNNGENNDNKPPPYSEPHPAHPKVTRKLAVSRITDPPNMSRDNTKSVSEGHWDATVDHFFDSALSLHEYDQHNLVRSRCSVYPH